MVPAKHPSQPGSLLVTQCCDKLPQGLQRKTIRGCYLTVSVGIAELGPLQGCNRHAQPGLGFI